jgi:N-acetylmuramoyl-L-alanine amidase
MRVLALLLAAATASSSAAEITVVGPGSRREAVDTWRVGDAEYVPVRVLSVLLGAKQLWHAELRKMTLEWEEGPVILVPGSHFVIAGEHSLQLTAPVALRSGEMWVPLELFKEPAASFSGLGLRWFDAERVVSRRGRETSLERATLEGWGDTLTVFMEIAGEAEPSLRHEGKRVSVHLPGASAGVGVPGSLGGGGPANDVRVVEDPAGVTVLVDLRGDARSTLEPAADGAVLKVWVTSQAPGPAIREVSATPTVVVDPGHGGRDPGATGKGGLREKWVTMKAARLLREELLKRMPSVRVVLTRKGDVMVPLKQRTEIANKERADVFISLHANFSYNRDARGMETYFLSLAKTDEERAVAAMENAPLAKEASWEAGQPSGELEFILWDSAQTAWLDQSQDLARHIQDLAARRGLGSRGVKQAGFYVLSGAYMPSVLVEVGFLSNRSEEASLKDERHLRKTAEVVADGAVQFLRRRSAG